MSRRPDSAMRSFRIPTLLLFVFAAACTGGGNMTRCPDDSMVQGNTCHLAPDGTYFGAGAQIPQDVADDVADEVDEDANEEFGEEEVVVTEIVIDDD